MSVTATFDLTVDRTAATPLELTPDSAPILGGASRIWYVRDTLSGDASGGFATITATLPAGYLQRRFVQLRHPMAIDTSGNANVFRIAASFVTGSISYQYSAQADGIASSAEDTRTPPTIEVLEWEFYEPSAPQVSFVCQGLNPGAGVNLNFAFQLLVWDLARS